MRSFGIWYKKNIEAIEGVKEPIFSVHINFWSESVKKGNNPPDLDVGIKIMNFKSISEVVFHCPFPLKETEVKDLSKKISDKKTANIIFNTDGEIETLDAYSIFKNGKDDTAEKLLIFPMKQNVDNVCSYKQGDNKTDIVFNLVGFERLLKCKRKFDEIDNAYIRFRISTAELRNRIYFDSEPLNKSFESAFSGTRIVDFKINEKRNLGEKTITDLELEKYSWPKFDKIHLLIMEPSSYDVESFANQKMTCRELEDKLWDDYFESEMDLSKGHILAYHWRFNDECSCLMKVKYSRAKWSTIISYILIVIALGIFGSTLVAFTQSLYMKQDLFFALVDTIVAIVLGVIAMLIGKRKK